MFTEFTVPTGGSFPLGITAGLNHTMWFAEAHGNKVGKIGTGNATPPPPPTQGFRTTSRDGNVYNFGTDVTHGSLKASGVAPAHPIIADRVDTVGRWLLARRLRRFGVPLR